MFFLVSFFLTFLLIFIFVKIFSKFQNPTREFVPKTESEKSKITPFGGLAILIGTMLPLLFFSSPAGLIVILPSFLMFLLGMMDDLKKVLSRKYNGVSAFTKITIQSVAAGLICFIGFRYNVNFTTFKIIIPFYGFLEFKMPLIFVFITTYFVFTGTVNAVNLTDGLDGLAGKQAFLLLAFLVIIIYKGGVDLTAKASILMSLLCLLGSICAFLFFNTNPATIFMGDSGSMLLGSMIATMFVLLKLDFILPFIGFIIFMEALSVIMQVTYFKITKGRRIFKMSPIHHHFQLCGVKEQKITEVSFLITFILCILFLTPFF